MGPFFWSIFKQIYVFCLWRFLLYFLNPTFANFLVSEETHVHQVEAHLGTNVITLATNLQKWKLYSRSREDTRIELFNGLCFTFIHYFFIHVVETSNVHSSSDAFITVSSIYGPTWPSFWTQIYNTFHSPYIIHETNKTINKHTNFKTHMLHSIMSVWLAPTCIKCVLDSLS